MASKYHHGAVECVLVTPLAPPPRPLSGKAGAGAAAGAAAGAGAEGEGGGKVWTGSADGTVFCWPDPGGSGQINEAEGKSIKLEGGKGEGQALARSRLSATVPNHHTVCRGLLRCSTPEVGPGLSFLRLIIDLVDLQTSSVVLPLNPRCFSP